MATHLNLTTTLADAWGLTPEQVAEERRRYPDARLHIPFRTSFSEGRTIAIEPVRKPYAGMEARR